jgi:hypothetical protein
MSMGSSAKDLTWDLDVSARSEPRETLSTLRFSVDDASASRSVRLASLNLPRSLASFMQDWQASAERRIDARENLSNRALLEAAEGPHLLFLSVITPVHPSLCVSARKNCYEMPGTLTDFWSAIRDASFQYGALSVSDKSQQQMSPDPRQGASSRRGRGPGGRRAQRACCRRAS